jgi:hypothetical protein
MGAPDVAAAEFGGEPPDVALRALSGGDGLGSGAVGFAFCICTPLNLDSYGL